MKRFLTHGLWDARHGAASFFFEGRPLEWFEREARRNLTHFWASPNLRTHTHTNTSVLWCKRLDSFSYQTPFTAHAFQLSGSERKMTHARRVPWFVLMKLLLGRNFWQMWYLISREGLIDLSFSKEQWATFVF